LYRQEDAEDVRTVALEHGVRFATVLVAGGEGLDDVGVDVRRERGEQLLARRIDEVEPACRHLRRG